MTWYVLVTVHRENTKFKIINQHKGFVTLISQMLEKKHIRTKAADIQLFMQHFYILL